VLAEKLGPEIMPGVVMLRPPHLTQRRVSLSMVDAEEALELEILPLRPLRRGW